MNVQRHIENLKGYGLPVVVALNHFTSDTQAEVDAVKRIVGAMGCEAIVCRHWAEGGKGAEELAHAVVAQLVGHHAAFAVGGVMVFEGGHGIVASSSARRPSASA